MIGRAYESLVKPVVRAVTPRWVWHRYGDARWYWYAGFPADSTAARGIGWPALLRLRIADAAPAAPGRTRVVRFPGFPHPIHYRPRSSDPDVIRQVFGLREYRCAIGLLGVEYILDCGANIGLTSLYLLHHYPAARAVVVEPDAGNMAVCRKNLAPFGDRVTFVQAGVWSASVPLVVDRGGYRDGREWSIQVRPARAGESPDLTARTVPELLAAGGFPRADIVKMDIEAAEAEVFTGPTDWVNSVRTLVIELHGPECERAVAKALSGRLACVGICGELTIYRRPESTPVAGLNSVGGMT